MNSFAFLIRHRTVDLVAGSAALALRDSLGMGERLHALLRHDCLALEGMEGGSPGEWARACAQRADWFNPNTHRHAFYEVAPGALAAAAGGEWPHPWLASMVESDLAELADCGRSGDLECWLGLLPKPGVYRVSLAAWDARDGVSPLPRGEWPGGGGSVLRFQLWTLALEAADADAAHELALELALTRRRGQGLLIHPHVERWAEVALPVALDEGASG